MEQTQKNSIIQTILQRERLRSMSRSQRLMAAPLRTFPFYIIAALTRIHPFKLRFKTLWGDKMTCYMPEGNTFLYYGSCEANLTNFLLKKITPGQTVIDIGAHVGFYSMLTSRLVSTNGQVHSFEPTPWTFNLLTTNTKDLGNVTLNNCAVSNNKGEIEFFDYGPGFGAFNTSDQKGAPALHKNKTLVRVPTVSVDEYCKEHNLKPDFIKLDAEGAEYLILQGMTSTLSKARPLISLEVAGDEQWKENREKSFEILAQHGYEAYDISYDGALTPHILRENYEYDNLIFAPSEAKEVL